uniref:Uncharacterized protein n=1 Tax=Aquila chrysaetos chrysaetos TaxID=223781 RepID=A0A663EKJ1_AQUCH
YSANKLREFIDLAPIFSVVHPGKDVCGFYPGQLRQVHKAHASRGAPGKLQPAPVNHEAETPFQPDLDDSALKKYSTGTNQSSYNAAFDLPYLNTSKESMLPKLHREKSD